jgi:hypothetical protein
MAKHSSDLAEFIGALPPGLFGGEDGRKDEYDVAGFSFGARCLVQFAATSTDAAGAASRKIRKLHLTGISPSRGAHAISILDGWKALLSSSSKEEEGRDVLRSFGESILRASHSSQFMSAQPNTRIESWVKFVAESNTVAGVGGIIRDSHGGEDADGGKERAVEEMITAVQRSYDCRFVNGQLDELCGYDPSCADATDGEGGVERNMGAMRNCRVFAGAGHAVPIERAREWRDDLLAFLNKDEKNNCQLLEY